MRVLWMVALIGCGDKDSDTSAAGTEPEALDCETEAWADQGDDSQAGFMADCVLPEMAALFQDFDASAYSDFSCASCHGEDLGGGTYAMPAATPIVVREQNPSSDIYIFMSETVMVEMAGILGYEPYDISTGSGDFSCYDCHIEGE